MNNLNGTSVLITGATGYIGSLLVKRLIQEGCEISILIRPSSDTKCLETILNEINVFVYDESYESVAKAIELSRPQLVYHLASFASIQYQSTDVKNMINSNILFGTLLIEAMANYNVKHFINTSSYSQHFNQEEYNPNSLYAATKQAYEDILLYYSQQISIINLVLFDNFGPNDHRSKVMNLLYRALTEGKTLSMSPGEQYLDLMYIDDVVDAYLVAGERLVEGATKQMERFSISSGRHIKLRELVRLMEEISGRTIHVKWDLDYRPGEIMVPWIKGNKLPGWNPQIPLEEGIRLFIENNHIEKKKVK